MKKGFIFSTDAFFAIILFILVVFLIYSSSVSYPGLSQQYFFSDDLLISISEVKISELNPANYNKINDMIANGKIEDVNIPVIEQIIIFQQNGDTQSAMDLTNDIISKITSQSLKTAVYVGDNPPIYGQDPSADVNNILTRTRLAIGKQ